MSEEFQSIGGIHEEYIENFEECKDFIKNINCCICLDIVSYPLECENCESLYCEDCWDRLNQSGRKCVINCTAPVKKANKFIYSMLNQLRIKCPSCQKSGIEYEIYIRHASACSITRNISTEEELLKKNKELLNKKYLLEKEFDRIQKLSLNLRKLVNEAFKTETINDNINKEQIRNSLITTKLELSQKMELYNKTVEGNLTEFKNLILVKNYPILEEISAVNYYWTSLHYAMHYGQEEIVLFILDYLCKCNLLELSMKLESNDGRCPLLCLIKSNTLQLEKKKEIIEKILTTYEFELNEGVKKEMKNRDMESILLKFKKTT
jgi:hypothetical protein